MIGFPGEMQCIHTCLLPPERELRNEQRDDDTIDEAIGLYWLTDRSVVNDYLHTADDSKKGAASWIVHDNMGDV